ncbi:hypothetical protein I4U23_015681 [Adineta vaga]|nr:hypothetical protein I4U23_015681 [Adineta vaga]
MADTNSNISTATHDSIDQARIAYLKDVIDVEDNEVIYLNRLLKLQDKRRELILNGNIPSVIIDNFLYQGDINHATDIDILNKLGIQHIINTCNSSLPQLITKKFNVLWLNILDNLHANIRQYFEQTNHFLYSCQQNNEKVLIHCHMGISRSSSITLAYLIKYHHNNLFEAYDYLLNQRLFASPNYGFFIQLIRYEKELQKVRINANKAPRGMGQSHPTRGPECY